MEVLGDDYSSNLDSDLRDFDGKMFGHMSKVLLVVVLLVFAHLNISDDVNWMNVLCQRVVFDRLDKHYFPGKLQMIFRNEKNFLLTRNQRSAQSL